MFERFFKKQTPEKQTPEKQKQKEGHDGWSKGDTSASLSQPKSLSDSLNNLLANYKLSETSDLRLEDVKGVLRLLNTEDVKLDDIDKGILNSGQFNTVDEMREMGFLLTKQGSGELSQEDKNRLKEYKQEKIKKNEQLSQNLEAATGVLGKQLKASQDAMKEMLEYMYGTGGRHDYPEECKEFLYLATKWQQRNKEYKSEERIPYYVLVETYKKVATGLDRFEELTKQLGDGSSSDYHPEELKQDIQNWDQKNKESFQQTEHLFPDYLSVEVDRGIRSYGMYDERISTMCQALG